MKKWIAKTRSGDMLSTGHHHKYGLSWASGILWGSSKEAWDGIQAAIADNDRLSGLPWDVYEVKIKDGVVFKPAPSDIEDLTMELADLRQASHLRGARLEVVENRLRDQAAAIDTLTGRVSALETSKTPAHGWRLLEDGEPAAAGDEFYVPDKGWRPGMSEAWLLRRRRF